MSAGWPKWCDGHSPAGVDGDPLSSGILAGELLSSPPHNRVLVGGEVVEGSRFSHLDV